MVTIHRREYAIFSERDNNSYSVLQRCPAQHRLILSPPSPSSPLCVLCASVVYSIIF